MKRWVGYAAGSGLVLSAAMVGGAVSCASTGHSGGSEYGDGGVWMGGNTGDGATTIVLPQGEGGGTTLTLEGGGTTATATMGDCNALKRACSSNCTDFPSTPVIDSPPSDAGELTTPTNAASYFTAAAGSGAGPCIVDPVDGTLIPQNWLRPRFRVIPAAGQNLFQITLTSTRQANPYVIYTANTSWTMPKTVWDALRADSWGDKVSVTIEGVNMSGGTPTSSTTSFTIAPASAKGSMIYWAAVGDQNGLSWLEGFAPGDESVATTLQVANVQLDQWRDQGGNPPSPSTGQFGAAPVCIGCHAAVPDGNSVTFLDFYPWPGSMANVNPDGGALGATPSWLTPNGAFALASPWLGAQTFSKTDWASERLVITSFGCTQYVTSGPWGGCSDPQDKGSLAWFDLAAAGAAPEAGVQSNIANQDWVSDFGTNFGILARTGDSNGVEFPNWSHDGTTIVYVSTNSGLDGRLAGQNAYTDGGVAIPSTEIADLYTVPFNARKGGAATPVMGASEPSINEYYPSFSEDDKLIAFDRALVDGPNGMQYNPYAEVYVISASGAASPTRLAANDPPSCQGAPGSPGVTNSWPKWSPDVETCGDGNTYYWLVFSSTREGIPFDLYDYVPNTLNFKNGHADGPSSQLYITGITVSNGTITTHPGLYIWNQGTNSAAFGGHAQSNHTPIWEYVSIPLPPPPPTQPK